MNVLVKQVKKENLAKCNRKFSKLLEIAEFITLNDNNESETMALITHEDLALIL